LDATMNKTLAGLAALAFAAMGASGSRAAEPDTVRLYYVPSNWVQSFNGVEAQLSTNFNAKATMSDDAYRTLLTTDGLPTLLLSCGSHSASVLFKEPSGRESIADHKGGMTFHGASGQPAVSLTGFESEGSIVARPTVPADGPAPAVVGLAALIGANAAFTLDYQREGAAVVHYVIAPAKMTGDMGGASNRADAAAAFHRDCTGIAGPATATR
jgi:hypothetical protein